MANNSENNNGNDNEIIPNAPSIIAPRNNRQPMAVLNIKQFIPQFIRIKNEELVELMEFVGGLKQYMENQIPISNLATNNLSSETKRLLASSVFGAMVQAIAQHQINKPLPTSGGRKKPKKKSKKKSKKSKKSKKRR